MSHSGTMPRPNTSPGFIRVITTGYVVNRNKELVFRKPYSEENSYFPEYYKTALQARFILFLPADCRKYKYGEAVKFNLDKMDKWKMDLKKFEKKIKNYETEIINLKTIGILEKILRYISKSNLKATKNIIKEIEIETSEEKSSDLSLEEKIKGLIYILFDLIQKELPTKLIDKLIDKFYELIQESKELITDYINSIIKWLIKIYQENGVEHVKLLNEAIDVISDNATFKFEYIASDVEILPGDFILKPFFDLIGELDNNSMERFIDGIDDIQTHNLKYLTQVNCKEGNHLVKRILILDSHDFDKAYGKPGKTKAECYYVKDCDDVDAEIEKSGQHKKSTAEDIPTKVGRMEID